MTSDVAVLCSLICDREGSGPGMLLYVEEGVFVAVEWVFGEVFFGFCSSMGSEVLSIFPRLLSLR